MLVIYIFFLFSVTVAILDNGLSRYSENWSVKIFRKGGEISTDFLAKIGQICIITINNKTRNSLKISVKILTI